MTQNMEKAQVLNGLFASLFTSKSGLQESQVAEAGGKPGERKIYPWWKRERLQNTSAKYTYVGPWDLTGSTLQEGMLRELADVITKSQ